MSCNICYNTVVEVLTTAPAVAAQRDMLVTLGHVHARFAGAALALAGPSQVPGVGHLAPAAAPACPAARQQQLQQLQQPFFDGYAPQPAPTHAQTSAAYGLASAGQQQQFGQQQQLISTKRQVVRACYHAMARTDGAPARVSCSCSK